MDIDGSNSQQNREAAIRQMRGIRTFDCELRPAKYRHGRNRGKNVRSLPPPSNERDEGCTKQKQNQE
jgi:hypothetical protein